MLNIVGHKRTYLAISAVLVAASVASIAIFGFKQGIDFAGGALWQFKAGEKISPAETERIFREDLDVTDLHLNYDYENSVFFARLPEINETGHQKFLSTLKERLPQFEELGFQSIGPSVGAELRRNAIWAIVFVLLGISFYIAFAFRKASRPISSWKYGFVTLLTLFHDVAIPAGMLAVLGYFGKVEIDTNFIVAILVVVGFSVHDTIVVFDRIRENLLLDKGKNSFEAIVNASINQTLARSFNTSFTLILVLIALLFFGPGVLWYFILTLLVGVSVGVYSSIFIASPGLLLQGHK